MTHFLKKTILAAVLGLGALAASVPAASAAGIGGSVETVGYRNGFHVQDRGMDRGRHGGWHRERHHGGWGDRGRCAPWLAVEKARSYGLRHAHVARVTPRQVVVEGSRFQRHGRIAFANARNCPVLTR